MRWCWGPDEEAKLNELKQKMASISSIGVPKSHGEMVLITDASDIGGGSTLFQWQSLDPKQVPTSFQTIGIKPDGSIAHSYPDNFRLVPLGHWNWKWNDARRNYETHEQELLACILTISSRYRISAN